MERDWGTPRERPTGKKGRAWDRGVTAADLELRGHPAEPNPYGCSRRGDAWVGGYRAKMGRIK